MAEHGFGISVEYSAELLTAVHNYDTLQCFTCYFKL